VLAPWFLAALSALVPLVALHLRRRRRRAEVAALLLWRDLPGAGTSRQRRPRLVLPGLLALQALVVVLLAVALTRPGHDRAAPSAAAAPVAFVVDGSVRMAMTDERPSRLAAARSAVAQRLAHLPAGTPVSLVAAGATPRLLVRDARPAKARAALARLTPTALTADLRAALALAAGQLDRTAGTVVLVRADGTATPRVRPAGGLRFAEQVIGRPVANVALGHPVARCGATADGPTACRVLVTVRNEGAASARARLTVREGDRDVGARTVALAAGGRADVALPAAAGARLVLRLARGDALAADDTTTVRVPASTPTRIVLVTDRPATSALARALAAAPGVSLRRVAPTAFRTADGRDADLLVLDRWLPSGAALPAARALLLVAPPQLPGGRVSSPAHALTFSDQDPGAAVLAGVDLAPLTIDADGLRTITLPASLHAAAWTADAPLVATGRLGDPPGTPTALLALDPERSDLPQLPAFPLLMSNLVAWSHGTTHPALPATAAPRTLTLRPAAAPAMLPARREWWPWLVAAALLVLLTEAAAAGWIAARGSTTETARTMNLGASPAEATAAQSIDARDKPPGTAAR
jgi:hypothetical protein